MKLIYCHLSDNVIRHGKLMKNEDMKVALLFFIIAKGHTQ